MIIPEKLKNGDKIGVVSTARKINLEEISPAVHILESWGLKIVFGKYLFSEFNQFSGTVEQRTEDFQTMIDDHNVKAILCARGGYGTVQIIDFIDFSKLIANPKWIIGYSDITVLHSHLNNLGIASMHATMPINFSTNTKNALLSLKNSIFGIKNVYDISPHTYNRFGEIKSELVGGNLSVLYSIFGSSSNIDMRDKILFIEDIDEYLYHIDRMIINFKRNGIFSNIKGLIIGGMTDMNDNNICFGKNAEQIIFDYVQEYDFPMCFNFPSGHLNANRCLILGLKTMLIINENGVSLQQEY